jgi:L-threonylcarbamoyladenylate synthase
VGLESTVVDLTGPRAVLLRPGAITLEDLRREIGDVDVEDITTTDAPRSPGQLLKHYAPRTPLRLKAVDVVADEALLGFGSTKFMGIKCGGFARDLPTGRYLNLSESGDLNEAAAHLFAYLHQLDASGAACIAVMNIPDVGLGVAINDRLKRAAAAME